MPIISNISLNASKSQQPRGNEPGWVLEP